MFIFLVFYVFYFVNHIQVTRTSVADKNDKVLLHFSKTRSEVQKPPSQLRFLLPSIIVTISSNEPWNTKTYKIDLNPQIANHDFLNPLKKTLFPKRSARMIDGSEERKSQLTFVLPKSRGFEKRGKNVFSDL